MGKLAKGTPQGVQLKVKVVPGASRTELVGVRGDALAVRLAAVPEKGRANEELRNFIAEALGVARSAVIIESGLKSRSKTIVIRGVDEQKVTSALLHLIKKG
ncbi:MAG: DUF167 domain-containing protein [Clostridia bacterium]|nr:DUF167 domain-containing protein [Clostridia bacterium]